MRKQPNDPDILVDTNAILVIHASIPTSGGLVARSPEGVDFSPAEDLGSGMLVLIGPILFIVLILFAIRLHKQGLAGWKAALLVVFGSALIVAIMFGLLFIGFEGFDRPPG